MRSMSRSLILRIHRPKVDEVIRKNQDASEELRMVARRYKVSRSVFGRPTPKKASVKTVSRSATATTGRGPRLKNSFMIITGAL